MIIISIHALLAESDMPIGTIPAKKPNFNPRSPCGERLVLSFFFLPYLQFQSTLSLRRATSLVMLIGCPPQDFNPRSPCGERPQEVRNGIYK